MSRLGLFAVSLSCARGSGMEMEMPMAHFVAAVTHAEVGPSDTHFQQPRASLVQTRGEVGTGAVKLNSTLTVARAQVEVKQKLAPKTWWAITISTALIVKTLCMVSNVIFQVSPFPTVKEFYSNADTGTADAAPYMSILYGGCQWCFYGMYAYIVTEKSGFLVLVYSNFLGAFLGVYYTYGFWQNCRDEPAVRRLYKYMSVCACFVLMQMVAMSTLPCQKALFFSGLVSSLCSIMVSLSMLATLPTIFATKCSSSINVPLVMVGAISAVLWLVCGWLLKDKWICVPNSIGLCILSFTLGLSVYFERDPVLAAAQCEEAAEFNCEEGSRRVVRRVSGVRRLSDAALGSPGGAAASAAAAAIRSALVGTSFSPAGSPTPRQPSPFAGIYGATQEGRPSYSSGTCGDTGGTV